MMDAIFFGVFKTIGILFGAGVVSIGYKLGEQYRQETLPNEGWKTLAGALVACLILATIYVSGIGTHAENCDDDPIRGMCETVEDYEPTSDEKIKEFVFALSLLYGPYAAGWMSNKKVELTK